MISYICFSLSDLHVSVWQSLDPSSCCKWHSFFFFFMAEWYSVVYMYHIFLIHSSTDRQKLSFNLCLLLQILFNFTFSQMGLKITASSNVAHSWFLRLFLSILLINMQTFFVRSSLLCRSSQVQPTATSTHCQHFWYLSYLFFNLFSCRWMFVKWHICHPSKNNNFLICYIFIKFLKINLF